MAEEEKDRTNLEAFSEELGFSLFGVADIRDIRDDFALEKKTSVKFDFALSLGKRLLDPVMDEIKDKPTPLYFHHYRQLNFFLDRAAFLLASHIQDQGFQALPLPASQTIDWDKQRGHISHKKVGRLAGLGWIGRNNLLVNPELGSRFRLVTVLTDMPLEMDSPLERDCGKCIACIKPCPAQAIKENPEDFDHIGCYEKLKEFRKIGLVGQYICGVCVRACKGPK